MFPFNRPTWLPSRQKTADLIESLRVSDLLSLRDVLLRLLLVVAVLALLILLVLLLKAEPIGALAEAGESTALLGALLGAQAAIAALTLAVTLFVMQAVSTRRDVDDRVYAEYVHRSRVRPIFWGSVGAVAVTGAILTTEKMVGDTVTIAQVVLGIPNLALIAVVAFVVNLAAAIVLFEQAIRLAKPEQWRSLRLDVNKRDVREAVRVFLGRLERAVVAQATNDADWSGLFPDLGEGSPDQAIRALLDDARRAMDERRQGELEQSLNSIKELVSHAMDEIENAGMPWGLPGSQAEWPPLRELGRNLYSFREEVIRAGNRECIFELLKLDYWLVATGLRRSCGELFTVGLSGYKWNYQVSTRLGGGESHEMLRDQFLLDLNGLAFGLEPGKLLPFMPEVIRHQESVLSDAMHANRVGDYQRLHDEFSSRLSDILQRWRSDDLLHDDESGPSAVLVQEHRIALMGLAGRSATLAESAGISDATPYLDVARKLYAGPTELGDDISAALMNERRFGFSQWRAWEMPDSLPGRVVSVSPERYPQTCFAVLLMEMADDATLALNLHGDAIQVRDWFLANSERLERFVCDTPSASARQRREFATAVLEEAVLRDEIEADREIIRRELGTERVGAFKFGVYAGMLKAGSVERLFEQAGAFTRLDAAAADLPEELVFYQLRPKAYFVDPAEGDRTGYAPIDGESFGRGLSGNVVHLLCEEMEGATPATAPLDTIDAVLRAIDAMVVDLAPQGNVAVVLAGDWRDVMLGLRSEEAEGYEPYWRLTEVDPLVDIGCYRGHPVLRGPTSGERRGYVVDLGTWGSLVRAPFEEDQDLRVDVVPISPERAQELLQANPAHYSDQPDHESKMRKLQTNVEVILGVRHGFRVIDPTRARRITSNLPLAESYT